jgi:hypothetical protein
MHAEARSFDLAREVDVLRQEPSWLRGDRNAKTLVQEHDLRWEDDGGRVWRVWHATRSPSPGQKREAQGHAHDDVDLAAVRGARVGTALPRVWQRGGRWRGTVPTLPQHGH